MLQLSSTITNRRAPFDHSLDGGHASPPTVPNKAFYGLLWSSSKTEKTSWNIRYNCRQDTFENYLLRLVYPSRGLQGYFAALCANKQAPPLIKPSVERSYTPTHALFLVRNFSMTLNDVLRAHSRKEE